MLAEKILTTFLRLSTKQYLSLKPIEVKSLPPPKKDRDYLLYVHVPFCESLCPYCSFNRFVFQEQRTRAYFTQLREELGMAADLGYRFPSLYVGGGTPTILIDELVKTLDLARDLFNIKEVSCETNPNHLTADIMSQLEGRVQRLSVGVQSFDNDLLRKVNRYDRFGSGEEIFERIQTFVNRFPVFNVDMIFNFPGQTPEMLRHDIDMIIRSGATQTTFYPLMVSPIIRKTLNQAVGVVDYGREAEFYKILCDGLESDYNMASAWAFTRKKDTSNDGCADEAIDEYIIDYEEYVGLGSGAFSYLDGALYVNTFSVHEYNQVVKNGRMSVSMVHRFDKLGQMRYRFMMQLFGLELDKRRFRQDFKLPIGFGLPLEMAFMSHVGAFSESDKECIHLTAKGRYLMVAMMREFFSGINHVRDQARLVLSPDELISARDVCIPVGECKTDSDQSVAAGG
jgi:coproporphyrinogen III oxidase-like Fe-S oxidoreductase